MTLSPCLSQKASQPTTNAVEQEISRKLARQEFLAPPPYQSPTRSTPPTCLPSVWRVRACHASRSVRGACLHSDGSGQCPSRHPGPATEAPVRHLGFPLRPAPLVRA